MAHPRKGRPDFPARRFECYARRASPSRLWQPILRLGGHTVKRPARVWPGFRPGRQRVPHPDNYVGRALGLVRTSRRPANASLSAGFPVEDGGAPLTPDAPFLFTALISATSASRSRLGKHRSAPDRFERRQEKPRATGEAEVATRARGAPTQVLRRQRLSIQPARTTLSCAARGGPSLLPRRYPAGRTARVRCCSFREWALPFCVRSSVQALTSACEHTQLAGPHVTSPLVSHPFRAWGRPPARRTRARRRCRRSARGSRLPCWWHARAC
jgi:hypothetical protein